MYCDDYVNGILTHIYGQSIPIHYIEMHPQQSLILMITRFIRSSLSIISEPGGNKEMYCDEIPEKESVL